MKKRGKRRRKGKKINWDKLNFHALRGNSKRKRALPRTEVAGHFDVGRELGRAPTKNSLDDWGGPAALFGRRAIGRRVSKKERRRHVDYRHEQELHQSAKMNLEVR